MVSQHALQVSRPTPGGGSLGGSGQGVSRPTPRGILLGGVVPGPGGGMLLGVCAWSSGVVETSPPGRLLLRAVYILLECILVASNVIFLFPT